MSDEPNVSPLQTVDRALQILNLFSPVCPELSVARVARELEVSRSIASRLLAALEMRRFVVQDPRTGRYRVGVRNLDLGALYVQSHRLVTAANPYMEQVVAAEGPGTMTNLFILDDGQALRLHAFPARALTRLRLPAHCTAAGKVLLASLPDEALEQLVAWRGLAAPTAHGITDPDTLRAELREVRRRGYATDDQEIQLGTYCRAAPIQDVTGATVGAVSIGCRSASPLAEERSARMIEAICAAARRISEALGSGLVAETPLAAVPRRADGGRGETGRP
jgi:IclR family transcriptional regulator, KDG regulon repressor